jgi:YVTN family beta-propeller protein
MPPGKYVMEQSAQTGGLTAILFSRARRAAVFVMFLLAACGTEGDSGSEPNTPLATPMALVVNQDDTTLTTVRLDGKGSPVISTLSLGPAQPDAIGGAAFSLGEWIFVTHTAQNRVATIDPIGALTPILESFLTENSLNPLVKIGQRPTRIYRDPVDKEVLWTTNEGDPVTGIDALAGCSKGGSVSVLHNSHLGVGGGEKPRITSKVCLSGTGDHFMAFSRPPLQQIAFVSSKTTGVVSLLLSVPLTGGGVAWSEFPAVIDLCSESLTAVIPLNCGASPAGLFWSQTTQNVYAYLSGPGRVVEINPNVNPPITRSVDLTPVAPDTTLYHSVGITPDGRFLLLAGEDILADLISSAPNVCQANPKVYGRLAVVDLTAPTLSVQSFAIPQLDNIRPVHFQFTPDGRRLYLTQSNKVNDLPCAAQAGNVKKDKLLVFDPATFPAAPAFVSEVDLPPVGSTGFHGMDVWVTGPRGAGSAKGVVVTNATPGVNGSVSLINAASNTITATIPVGRNPKQVTVYYYGLAASDNQATPIW